MLVGSALLIGVAVCTSVWFFLSEHKDRGSPAHENSSSLPRSEFPINNRVTPVHNPDRNPGEEPLTFEGRVARQAKRNFIAMYSEDELATPMRQKFLEAMNSPEYFQLLKEMKKKGAKIRNWYDFLESKGIPIDRDIYAKSFRMYFPTGEPEDYEQEMRIEIAKLFLAAEPVDLADPAVAATQRYEVFREFRRKEKRNSRWFRAMFDEDWDGYNQVEREGTKSNPAFIWMTDVQQNAERIVAAAETAGDSTSESQTSVPSWDLSSVMESPAASPNEMSGDRPSMVVPLSDADERPTNPNTASRAAVTPAPGLTNVPKTPTNLPTIEGLETSLKEQFSSERFERAMSTLERYGPEEGLRRLKENDPEVAKQVERHRNRKEVSQ